MCGIQLLVTTNQVSEDPKYERIWDLLKLANSKRGPDYSGYETITIGGKGCEIQLSFGAHVLNLRGEKTPQPFIDPCTGDLLLFNGEIFSGLQIGLGDNDGVRLFEMLQNLGNDSDSIFKIFSTIRGPYSFVYFKKTVGKIWFGRDFLGRRSLLKHVGLDKNIFVLSSTGYENNDSKFWEEVCAPYIHCLDVSSIEPNSDINSYLTSYKWEYDSDTTGNSNLVLPFNRVNTEVLEDMEDSKENMQITNIKEYRPSQKTVANIKDLHNLLMNSVKVRVETSPGAGFAVLFSGGLDCMVLAALMDSVVPKNEAIELINVAFANPRILKSQAHKTKSKTKRNDQKEENSTGLVSFNEKQVINEYNVPDRKTGLAGVKELRESYPQRKWHWIEVNVPYSQVLEHKQHIVDLLGPNSTVMDFSIGMALWFAARGKGTLVQDENSEPTKEFKSSSKVLILGMGADEQFGGYSRHREGYNFGGLEKLANEVRFF
ncbi:hypothetical protein BB558_003327 [Smittium angustum]|uniref:Glutamine amidotransferase type-2 domain-containing protein n=1 Tax=Smittium angustum TaxID=133377 RepID=A0A2U1J6N3_SMIAN|nr:hypothetical protein BB558_003327 [Smittium angustum]